MVGYIEGLGLMWLEWLDGEVYGRDCGVNGWAGDKYVWIVG